MSFHTFEYKPNRKFEFAYRTASRVTYDQAWLYCATLNRNGHSDWRLMTVEEGNELTNDGYTFHHGCWRERTLTENDDENYLEEEFYKEIKCPVVAVRTVCI